MKTPIQSGLYHVSVTLECFGTLNGHLTITASENSCILSGGDSFTAWYGRAEHLLDESAIITLEAEQTVLTTEPHLIVQAVSIIVQPLQLIELNDGSAVLQGLAETVLSIEPMPIEVTIWRVQNSVL